MANLSLYALDEVISARRSLHGGTRGAPVKLTNGSREGDALNRACVVLLSSSLQSYVQDVFLDCSFRAFGRDLQGSALKNYKNTWSRWGNPNPSNIIILFRRLGIDDVFDGLSWQGQATPTLKENFDRINQIRNSIAHGGEIRVNNEPYSLQLNNITRWRNIAEQFGVRFETHARAFVQ